jgi:hypothetical protein
MQGFSARMARAPATIRNAATFSRFILRFYHPQPTRAR